MFLLLGISISLATLSVFDALVSIPVILFWRGMGNRLQSLPSAARANLLLGLRFLPAVVACLLVFAFVIPAYLIYEPRETSERVGLELAFLAALSVVFVLLAAFRFVAAQIATRNLVKNWLQNSEQLRDLRLPIPVYRLRHPFPVIAVTGVLRRKLFIADQLFDLLSKAELTAAYFHEYAHLKARDNIKRAILRSCCDFLAILPVGQTLNRAWAEASEVAADDYAARMGAEASLDLASALVKIARIIPGNYPAGMPAPISLMAGDSSTIELRVRRLIELAGVDPQEQRSIGDLFRSLFCSIIIAMIVALAALFPYLLSTIHEWIEIIVWTLQ
jgi:Zn-dependent protease with chaperone function